MCPLYFHIHKTMKQAISVVMATSVRDKQPEGNRKAIPVVMATSVRDKQPEGNRNFCLRRWAQAAAGIRKTLCLLLKAYRRHETDHSPPATANAWNYTAIPTRCHSTAHNDAEVKLSFNFESVNVANTAP